MEPDSTDRMLYTALSAQFAPGELRGGWECWTGVSGMLYARLRPSSPPIVLRAPDVPGLAHVIREWQAGR